MIRFFLCNVFISGITGILLIVKRIFKNSLSSRMQYNLWFLLLGLLAVTTGNTNWMNDFNLSVNSETPSIAGYILLDNMDCRYSRHDNIGNQILSPFTHFGEICTSTSKSGSPQTVSSMFGENGDSQRYSCLQHRIFEISHYCQTFKTVYLSSDSSDL